MIYASAAFIIATVLGGLIWGAYLLSWWLKHKAPRFIRDAATSMVVLLIVAGVCLSFKGGGVFAAIAKGVFWLLVALYFADIFTKYARGWKTKLVTLTHKEKGESRS